MDVKMALPPANEIKLYCGVYRRAKVFSVVARLDEQVECLLIKLGEQLGVIPMDLGLYLAKKKGGDWVKSDEELKSFLSRGPVRNESGGTAFNRMWPSNLLSKYFDQQTLPYGVVHVLVELTENYLKRQKTGSEVPSAMDARMAPLDLTDLKAKASKSGDLPKDGDFLKLFEWNDDDCGSVKDIQAIGDIVGFTGSKFYVRKEILRVLENFKKFLHVKFGITTEEFRKEQFIFMGSSGMGKSCILALICFYLAIEKNVPVVWHGVVAVGGPATRLFHQGKYYEWPDSKGDIYSTIYDSRSGGGFDPASCWFCIDGLSQEQLARTNFGTAFTLLATSGQFEIKGESGAMQIICLVPYWRLDDLKDLASKCWNLNESDVAGRYFVSGGRLSDFLLPEKDARDAVNTALRKLDANGADVLLTTHRCSAFEPIDRIHMLGVQETSNLEHYLLYRCWRSCITSRLAMEYLLTLTKPDNFHKRFVVAKDVNDPQLQSLVLEHLFRSIVRYRKSVGIVYMKYDNVDRRTHRDPEHRLMREDNILLWA